MDEIIAAFSREGGIEANVTYGAVGTLLSQILLSRRGDLFVVPSMYMMDQARAKGVIVPGSTHTLAYVVPAINVQKGNPQKIAGLKDLTRASLRIALANPETVFTGMVAAEIVEKSLTPEERRLFKRNVVTYTEDFSKLAMTLALKKVDVILGLHNLDKWYPDKIETVRLKAHEVQRIGAGQLGILSESSHKVEAQKLKEYITSKAGQQIFAKYHYFATPQQAFNWIGEAKPVGGERPASPEWFKN